MEPIWESDARLRSIPKTAAQVVTAPIQTFGSLAPDRSLTLAAGFLIAVEATESFPAIIGALGALLRDIPDPMSALPFLFSAWIKVLISQAVQVSLVSVSLLIAAMTPHIALQILGKTDRQLNDTARAMAYVTGTFYLLHWIPAYGSSLVFGLQLVYGAAALRGLHRCPWWKAIAAGALVPLLNDLMPHGWSYFGS